MSDVNANINIDIDSSGAVANLKALENSINQFNRKVVAANSAAAANQRVWNTQLLDSINHTKMFDARIVDITSSSERFSTALEKNKLTLGEYTKYAASQMPGMSRVFKKEFDTISNIAETRVKKMQTQFIALGRTVDGVSQAIASTPTGLARGYATDLSMATQKQQIFNKLIDDGSTKLLNWGKNTQWAGRQLMVGFTIPLAALGTVSAKTFMEIDKASLSLKRVYGDLSTSTEEIERNVEAVSKLGTEYTKYGISLAETIGIAGRAAATGAQNETLLAATEETLRFATLGQIDYQQALDTTISLQTAFGVSNEELANKIDFLNAVENQTILTIEDMSLAIPRVATVIKGLGGDVEDLAIMMTAMREGGVSAENAANALKSGLASLINPTKRATESLAGMGINITSIVNKNKGDLMGLITDFANATNALDEFSRQQVFEQVFGKYQYARMSALFTNITNGAGQASRAMELAGRSAEELADISSKELNAISETTSVKFEAAMERLKVSIAPLGEAFLKGITPIVELVTKIADAFNNLPDPVKNAIAVITAAVAGLGPIILMSVGLIGNGIANIIKTVQFFRKGLAGLKGDASAFQYLAASELEAVAATESLEISTAGLTSKLLLQKRAVDQLTLSYQKFASVAGTATSQMSTVPRGAPSRGTMRAPIRRAMGGTIPGTGNTDTVPAMLTPGEFVINKKDTAKNLPLLHAINNGQSAGGFNKGGQIPGVQYFARKNRQRMVQPKDINSEYPEPGRGAPQTMRANANIISDGGYSDELFLDIYALGLGRKLTKEEAEKLKGRLSYETPSGKKARSGYGGATTVAHIDPAKRNESGLKLWRYDQTRLTSGLENSALQNVFRSEKSKSFFSSLTDDLGLNLTDSEILKSIVNGRHPNSIHEYELLEKLFTTAKQPSYSLPFKEESSNNMNMDFLIGVARGRRNPEELAQHGPDPYNLFTGEPLTFKETIERAKGSSLGPFRFSKGGQIPGGKVTQSRPFYGRFNAKTIETFKNWIGTHSEAIPALRQTILKDPKMKSMFGAGFSRSTEPETLLRSQFMSSVPEVGSELSLGALRSFSAEGTDVVRHLADSKIRKQFEHASYELTTDKKLQERSQNTLRKAEAGLLPPYAPEHRYRSPMGGKVGLDAWIEDTKMLMGPTNENIKRNEEIVRRYKELSPTVIKLKTPTGTVRANLDDIVPALEQQYGSMGSSSQVNERERILHNAKIKVTGSSTDKQGIVTLDAELIESFGLNKDGKIPRYANGGSIFATNGKTVPGIGNTDTVPAMLTPGEFVVNKEATQSNLGLLHAINNGNTSQSGLGFNKGGQIPGVQYFAKDEEERVVQSRTVPVEESYRGPPSYRAESAKKTWESLSRELEAIANIPGITENQLKAYSQKNASHIRPQIGEQGGKLWLPENMQSDLGVINNYIQGQKNVAKRTLEQAELFEKVVESSKLPAETVRKELDNLSNGLHATTRESAIVLKALADTGKRSTMALATSAVIEERLKGDYYETLQQRTFDPSLPAEEIIREDRPRPTAPMVTPEQDAIKGTSYELTNQERKRLREEARRTVAESPVSKYQTEESKIKMENEIFESKMVKEREKKRSKLIKEEYDFLRTRKVDHDKAMQIAQRTVDAGQAGVARTKSERRFARSVVPEGTQSLPIISTANIQEPDIDTEQRTNRENRRGRVARGAQVGGGILMMASMMPATMSDQQGNFMGMNAGALTGGMMGAGILAELAPMLSKVPPQVLAIGAAVAVLTGGFFALKKGLDNNIAAGRAWADSLTTTAKEQKAIASLFGTTTLAEKRLAKERTKLTGLTTKEQELGKEFVATEPGQAMVEQAKVSLEKNGASFARNLGTQLSQMVVSGAITPKNAKSIALGITDALGREDLTANVTAQIDSILGVNGEDITNTPMIIIANIQASLELDEKELQFEAESAAKQYNDSILSSDNFLNLGSLYSGEYDRLAAANVAYYNTFLENTKSILSSIDDEIMRQDNLIKKIKEKIAAEEDADKRRRLITEKENAVKQKTALIDKKSLEETQRRQLAINLITSGGEEAIHSARQAIEEQYGVSAIEEMLRGGRGTVGILSRDKFNTTDINKKEIQKNELETNLLVDMQMGKIDVSALKIVESWAGTGESVTIPLFLEAYKAGDYESVNKILSYAELKDEVKIVIDPMLKEMNYEKASEFLDVLSLIPPEIQIKIAADLSELPEEKISKFFNSVNSLKKMNVDVAGLLFEGGVQGILYAGEGIEQITTGMQKYGKEIKALKKETKEGKIKKTSNIISKIFGENITPESIQQQINSIMKDTNLTEEQVINLPPQTFVATIQMKLKADSLREEAGNMFRAARQIALFDEIAAEEMRKDASAMLDAASYLDSGAEAGAVGGAAPATTEQPKPESGGGGTKEDPFKDFMNALKERLKIYTNFEKILSQLKGSKNKFEKSLSLLEFKGGFIQKLRKQNLSESFISEILSQGLENGKKIYDQLVKRGQLQQANRAYLIGQAAQTSDTALASAISLRQQMATAGSLRAIGGSEELVQRISGDTDLTAEYRQLQKAQKTAKTTKQRGVADRNMDKFLGNQELEIENAKELARTLAGPVQNAINDMTFASELHLKVLDEQIKAHEKIIKTIQDQIDVLQEMNSDDQNRIRSLEREKEMIQRKIDQLNHENELDQQRIDRLSREDEIRKRISDALSHDLEQMSLQEEKIRDTYDERIKALDKIEQINQNITNQQKSQLSLAQSLSTGDVYAAAQAQQDMQTQQAQTASQQMRAGLETGMENQVAALTTPGGLTRVQAEQQMNQIKEQSYQTSLQIRDIEDSIYERNLLMLPLKEQIYNYDLLIRGIADDIYDRESKIIEITENRLEPAQDELEIMQEKRDEEDASFRKQIEMLELGKSLQDMTESQRDSVYELAQQWAEVVDMIAEANRLSMDEKEKINDKRPTRKDGQSDQSWQKEITAWQEKRDAEIKLINERRDKRIENARSRAKRATLRKKITGGMIYGDGSRDSVPAILSPGEFVMRKAAVSKYGPATFEKMNMGSFSMPGYNEMKPTQVSVQNVSPSTNISAPVYNTYSVNVPVNQPGASADEIANKVITKIRSIDNMSVKSFRGY